MADRYRSQTVCRAPSNSRSCSTSQGTSSRTMTLGVCSGTAIDRARSVWFQSAPTAPATRSAPGRADWASAAVKSARSAAGLRPRDAWKTRYGALERSQNSWTSRDLPTLRRPVTITACPGVVATPSRTRRSCLPSSARSLVRPRNVVTLYPDLSKILPYLD